MKCEAFQGSLDAYLNRNLSLDQEFGMDTHKHVCPACRVEFDNATWNLIAQRGYFGIESTAWTKLDPHILDLSTVEDFEKIVPWACPKVCLVQRLFKDGATVAQYFAYAMIRTQPLANDADKKSVIRISAEDNEGRRSHLDLTMGCPQGKMHMPVGADPATTQISVHLLSGG